MYLALAIVTEPVLFIVKALGGVLALAALALLAIRRARLAWARWRARRRFEFGGIKYRARPLRRGEFCTSPVPPAPLWRGQSRSYRNHFGAPLWA